MRSREDVEEDIELIILVNSESMRKEECLELRRLL